MPKQQKTAAEQIAAHLRARELGRRQYAKADRLLEELIKSVAVGEVVELPDGRRAILKDRYADRNKVFKPCGVSRYEIEAK